MCSVDARTPLGKCFGINTSLDSHKMLAQNAWDRKQARGAQARDLEDAKFSRVLENACFFHQCSWRDCAAVLGSWELLRKHVEKMHCEEVSPGQTSSSRPYRCRYAACYNRMFPYAPLLLEHIVSSHLEQLKLRCPLGCRQTSSRIQSLVQHLKSVHDTTPYELPSTEIRRPPPRQEPLPELPTYAPTYLIGRPAVNPSSSFGPSKAALVAAKRTDAPEDEWSDFAGLSMSGGSNSKPFGRLRWPIAGEEMASVRTVPRGGQVVDTDESASDEGEEGPEAEDGPEESDQDEAEDEPEVSNQDEAKDSVGSESPKVGFAYWKRRFKKERKLSGNP